MHDALYARLQKWPGRVAFGAATPGFDDVTEDWGRCVERQLPPGDPRDPDVLRGEFDYFASKGTRGRSTVPSVSPVKKWKLPLRHSKRGCSSY